MIENLDNDPTPNGTGWRAGNDARDAEEPDCAGCGEQVWQCECDHDETALVLRDKAGTGYVPLTEHRMIGGSHERPNGAECLCGAPWDNWNGVCTSNTGTQADEPRDSK